MKYNVRQNKERRTISVVISPVVFNFTRYLYQKYNDEKFFATGVLDKQDYTEDILPFVKDVVSNLNEISKGVLPPAEKFVPQDLITLNENEYRLLSKNILQDGTWNKEFKINLSSKTKRPDKKFLYSSLKEDSAISEESSKGHKYGVEIEIGVGYNEDNLEKYIYTVFHRAISIGQRESGESIYKASNDAWSGFNFGSEEESPF